MDRVSVLTFFAVLIMALDAHSILVIGHRGARAHLPENTLAGIKYAAGLGIDMVEFDVAVSRDNHVVVHHDSVTNDLLCQFKNGSPIKNRAAIRGLSLQEIKEIDCGTRTNPKFPNQVSAPGEEIPTLREVFDWYTTSSFKDRLLLAIEMKRRPGAPMLYPKPEDYASLVLGLVQEYKLLNNVVIKSFDKELLTAVRSANAGVDISFLSRSGKKKIMKFGESIDVTFLTPRLKKVRAKNIELWQENGFNVLTYTANKQEDWNRLLEAGINGIVTDDPAGLLEYLRAQNLR